MGGKKESIGGFTGLRLVGGIGFKSGRPTIINVDDDELQLVQGFQRVKWHLSQVAVYSGNLAQARAWVADAVDPYEWPKDKESFLLIGCGGERSARVVFEDAKARQDAAKIHERIKKAKQRAAVLTQAGMEWAMAGPADTEIAAAPMQKLGRKEQQAVEKNLLPGEAVICQVVGASNQALVVTNRKTLIIKAGFMAGATFGAKVTSFDLRTVASVEVRVNMMTGTLQISAGGLQTSDKGYWGTGRESAFQSPNVIPFPRGQENDFQRAAAIIRELAAAAHTPASPTAQTEAPAASIAPDPIEQLRKLAELKDAGVLTAQEFNRKKADILGRM